MNIDQRLDIARQLLLTALPDNTAWSGPAASAMELRIHELLAQLDGIQGGLWR